VPFDGLVLYSVTRELEAVLLGGRIERVYQPAALEIIIAVRNNHARYRLLLSAAADAARVHLTEADRRNPAKIPFFCSALRRRLEGSRFTEISQPGLERVLRLVTLGTDELGRPETSVVIAEIMGKHSNIILLDPLENKIIDAVKRYSHTVSRYREVLPGQPYTPAPPSHKADPGAATEEGFIAALSALGPDMEAASGIQRLYEGFSLFSARALVRRAGLEPDTALESCGLYEYRRLFTALKEIVSAVINGEAAPTVIRRNGTPVDYAAFDPDFEAEGPPPAGMNLVLDRFYQGRARAAAFAAQKRRIIQRIGRDIDRLNKKQENVQAALADPDTDRYRLYGELLTANLYRLQSRGKEVSLENFLLPGAPEIIIPLDETLTPAQNAQRYFKKYARARSGLAHALKEREHIEEELQYLSGVSTAADQADNLEELTEIAAELEEQGYLSPAPEARKQKTEPPEPLKVISSDNHVLLIGKNNRQNDYVTFRLAVAEDIWFHARGVAGAHVILKTGGRKPSAAAISEAASLAAYFSQGRHSSSVPVDYTPRANVRRPKGARPGFVTYTGENTVFADPSRAKDLLTQPAGT
jgi:predicted ribosome quality control (RQC) complex YloA/Tae2 family protein